MLGPLINKLVRPFGLQIGRYQKPSKDEQIVSLKSAGRPAGNVLLSYIIDPFLLPEGVPISNDHTHDWESYQIAQTFLNYDYAVDVISYLNRTFVPSKRYDFFVAARTNFDRITKVLNKSCVKVVHFDTAHWLFNNQAAYTRLLSVQQRRGVTLADHKMVEANWAIESADLATILGNQFTLDTYCYVKKPIYRIPISAPAIYEWDINKNFDQCRRNYLWFGSSGFVHKGLDLVLEAFAEMPEYQLTVCGPFNDEDAFIQAYHRELYQTPNIRAVGWVDVKSQEFLRIAHHCIALVYPTCAEGGGASAITCMHAGVIPILTYEASVDIDNCGILLPESSVRAIRDAVVNLSNLSANELQQLARRAWELVRRDHTRRRFAEEYDRFVSDVLLGRDDRTMAAS